LAILERLAVLMIPHDLFLLMSRARVARVFRSFADLPYVFLFCPTRNCKMVHSFWGSGFSSVGFHSAFFLPLISLLSFDAGGGCGKECRTQLYVHSS